MYAFVCGNLSLPQHGILFIETSAKAGDNVKSFFRKLVGCFQTCLPVPLFAFVTGGCCFTGGGMLHLLVLSNHTL